MGGKIVEVGRTDVLSAAIRGVLVEIGEDPARDGLLDTPKRWANAMRDLTEGYFNEEYLPQILTTFDAEGADQMVIVSPIPLFSLCEHHILPFAGHAHIGYIPRDRLVGLSKFKRVVDVFAKRLQVQERLTRQIANALEEHLEPRGVIVVIEAEHFCMTMRGVQTPGTLTLTSAVTGDFADPTQGSREEFMALLNRKKGN